MEKFTRITATACPLPAENIDTDQILPARYLKLPRKGEHGKVLFQDLRFDAAGNERPDFALNRSPWREAKIIVGGRNFGGGSSREAAVYALFDYGIRCVIAPSFGDIFSQNATKNGLLTAVVTEAEGRALTAALTREPALAVTVDLEAQSIVCGELALSIHDRPRAPYPPAERMGRYRSHQFIPRSNRRIQSRRFTAAALGHSRNGGRSAG